MSGDHAADPCPLSEVTVLQPMGDNQNKPIYDLTTLNQVIDVMLEELDELPEPLQTVPEELQPMLERIQRMAEQNQAGLDPIAQLGVGDHYNNGFQFEEFPGHGHLEPPQVLGEGYEPQGHPGDPNYEQVCQTITELCQIMTPVTHQESATSCNASGVQADMQMYQASTSHGYPPAVGPPAEFQLPQHQQQNFQFSQLEPQGFHWSGLPHLPPPHEPLAEPPPEPTPTLRELLSPSKSKPSPMLVEMLQSKGDNPRELRNQAEKQRRNRLKHSIALLATIVPPVLALPHRTDRTNIMRLSAHFLRSHQYVFGDSVNYDENRFTSNSMAAVLSLFKGFLLTLTYKGIVVVVSHNVQEYLGYTELDLIGTSVFGIVHHEDQAMLQERLMPPKHLLGKYGDLLVPDEPGADQKIAELLAKEKRSFIIRLRQHGHRSEPARYLTCHVEGFLRKSDKAGSRAGAGRLALRRARARADNPRSSGNDVVFVGMVRPVAEGYKAEGIVEGFRMEYRTRHSLDGDIIQCEQRLALVTGYTRQEVHGINAMNFMHRDDVHWVKIALREMYDQQRLFGESCYRLKMKNGQFVYMRTRGTLEVDENSKIATTFVCTNTVVDEVEGKYFIKQMRKRFTISIDKDVDDLMLVEPTDHSVHAGPKMDNLLYYKDFSDLQLPTADEDITEALAPDWESKMDIQSPYSYSSDSSSEHPTSRKRRRLDSEIYSEPSTSYGQSSPQRQQFPHPPQSFQPHHPTQHSHPFPHPQTPEYPQLFRPTEPFVSPQPSEALQTSQSSGPSQSHLTTQTAEKRWKGKGRGKRSTR